MNNPGSLCRLPIHDVASLIRGRRVSSVEVVRATLEEIERCDSQLNSYITVVSEQAVDRARTLDNELARGRLRGPLHGIPVSLKDNIDTAGVRTTCGSPLFNESVPERDAEVWGALEAAGAVLVGKNNLWELALGGPHPAYGPSWNPCDPTRTSGGTSSGSAAAVAAGLCAASLGTDTGGSARVPAALCGLVSIKPTYGRVSGRGVLPVSHSMDHVCPITRAVEDSAFVLAALAPDWRAPDVSDGHLVGARVGVIRPLESDGMSSGVLGAFEHSLSVIVAEGARIVETAPPDIDAAVVAGRITLEADAADLHRARFRAVPQAFGPITADRLRAAEFIPATAYVRAQRVRRWIAHELEALLRQLDVLVLPATNDVAYPVGADGWETASPSGPPRVSGRFMLPFDATGHPAIVVPSGTVDGLPSAIQFVAAFGRDEELLAFAQAFERALGWSDAGA